MPNQNQSSPSPSLQELRHVLWNRIKIEENEIPSGWPPKQKEDFLKGVKNLFIKVLHDDVHPEQVRRIMQLACQKNYTIRVTLSSTVDHMVDKGLYNIGSGALGFGTGDAAYIALGILDGKGEIRIPQTPVSPVSYTPTVNPKFFKHSVHEMSHSIDIDPVIQQWRFSPRPEFAQVLAKDSFHVDMLRELYKILEKNSGNLTLNGKELESLEAYYQTRKTMETWGLPNTFDEYMDNFLAEHGFDSGRGMNHSVNRFLEKMQRHYTEAGIKSRNFAYQFTRDAISVKSEVIKGAGYSTDAAQEAFARGMDHMQIELNHAHAPLANGRNPIAAALFPNLEHYFHASVFPELSAINLVESYRPEIVSAQEEYIESVSSEWKALTHATGLDKVQSHTKLLNESHIRIYIEAGSYPDSYKTTSALKERLALYARNTSLQDAGFCYSQEGGQLDLCLNSFW